MASVRWSFADIFSCSKNPALILQSSYFKSRSSFDFCSVCWEISVKRGVDTWAGKAQSPRDFKKSLCRSKWRVLDTPRRVKPDHHNDIISLLCVFGVVKCFCACRTAKHGNRLLQPELAKYISADPNIRWSLLTLYNKALATPKNVPSIPCLCLHYF